MIPSMRVAMIQYDGDNDVITGGFGNDVITGGSGHDIIVGQSDDTVYVDWQ